MVQLTDDTTKTGIPFPQHLFQTIDSTGQPTPSVELDDRHLTLGGSVIYYGPPAFLGLPANSSDSFER